jgi:hypothetical protein
MKTALILHPDWSVRDPYGVVSRDGMREICRYAEVWKRGWDDRAALANREKPRGCWISFAGYCEVREYLMGLVDLPYYLICEIALFLTKENKDLLDPFNPVL